MMQKRLLLLTLTFLLPIALAATVPDMKFRRLDTRDGLSNSQVMALLRDSKGIVWIGTPYGLNRYDGYRVHTFYSDPRDSTTLRSNYVDAIFEATDGKLWLRQGMSYSIFDPLTERCDRHPERWLEKQGIKGGIEFLHIDSQGDFWVKTYTDGFYHYRPKTKSLKRYPFGYGEQEFVPDIGVSSIIDFDEKTVALSSTNGHVIFFDRENDVISRRLDYLPKNKLTNDRECKLRTDHDGNLWVITVSRVYVWNPKTNEWLLSAQDAVRSIGVSEVPEEMAVWDIMVDGKNRLWIATDHGGLYIIDLTDKSMRQFLTSKYDESTISDNTLRVLYKDQLGRMWVGSYMNGLNLYTGNASGFRNRELGVINTICYDRQGYTWLGTNDVGIIRYDSRTGEQVAYNKANSGIGSNVMVGSLAASDGSVWFGTYEGGLIHIKNGEVTNYRATGDTLGLVNNNVWTVCEDQWGNIWIGTLGGGVQRIDKRTGKMRTFRISNSNLPSDYISTITRTKKGWLMVAHSKFYSLINPKTFRIVNRDITNNHNNIDINETSILVLEDSRGLAWQGSTSGATVWDPKTNEVYLLDMRSGLLGSTVNGIVEDANHSMWLVTDHGISNVIVQHQDDGRYTFIVRSYNSRDGLQVGPYNQRSTCYTPTGMLLVGGQGGLDVLNPGGIGKDRVKEEPVFSGLQLFDQDVIIGEETADGRVVLKENINECRQLTLRYNDQFTILLASSSGEIHNRSRFLYKLEGFNDNWVKTSEANPSISYMSLPSGSYTLCVRMLNDDGTMGDVERSIDITIRPPLYATWWAILLYIIVGGCLAFLWYQRTLRRHAERVELERQLREYEKQELMRRMRAEMEAKQPEPKERTEDELTYRPVISELVGFVKRTAEEFKSADGKPFKMTFQSALNRLTMKFDMDLLYRMLHILLANAVRFSPAGSRVRVNLAEVGNMAEIRITDRGLGIPEESRANMFDPNVESVVEFDVVARIVNLHGGTVRAEDNPEGGTIVIVQLPIDMMMSDDIPVEDAVLMD